MEFDGVHVLDSHTIFSRLLNVESVGEVEDVGVGEADRLRHVLLESGSRVENELDPSLGSLMSNVVLQWSSDLALAGKGSVDEPVKDTSFNSRDRKSVV